MKRYKNYQNQECLQIISKLNKIYNNKSTRNNNKKLNKKKKIFKQVKLLHRKLKRRNKIIKNL